MIDPKCPQDYHEAMCLVDDLKRQRDQALADCERLRARLAEALNANEWQALELSILKEKPNNPKVLVT